MRKTTDAVIIGGGAVGTSVLYHLTAKGLRDVVLLEKGGLCSGSSGDSAAIVRQHYSNEVSIRLVMRSLRILEGLSEGPGGAGIYTAAGWIFLCPPEFASVFRDNMARLQALGVRTWEISVEDAAEELPGLNTEGIGPVAFEPDSGYADPHGMANAFVDRARAAGAETLLQTAARDIKTVGGRVEGVVTDDGVVSTGVVVNAAGPWAGQVGRWAGLDLPLQISREQDIVIRPPADAAPIRRAVSNMVDRTYLRPEPGGTVLAGTGHPKENEPVEPDDFNRSVDSDFVEDVTERLVRRFPALAGSEFIAGWAGLYTITPDWSMIVDEAPGVDGLYLAVGGSGHSFKLAPAVGLCLAELIVDGRATTVDISPLRASRFDESDPMRSTYGGNRG